MYEAVVMGASTGGLNALTRVLSRISPDFPAAIIIAQHIGPDADDFFRKHLDLHCPLEVLEAQDKLEIMPGKVYLAPPNYHTMIDDDRTLALSVGEKVNFSRPSIDVLFETAAQVYTDTLIGVIMTGANSDGTKGIGIIKEFGRCSLVQLPNEAEASVMPESPIKHNEIDYILTLEKIALCLNRLTGCQTHG